MFWKKQKSRKIPLSAPGPSPWYLRAPTASINSAKGIWTWATYDDSKLSGISRLISPEGMPVLFLDFHCYVLHIADTNILVWYEIGRNEEESSHKPSIEFVILDVSELETIEDHEGSATELRESGRKLLYKGEHVSVFSFSSALSEGKYSLESSDGFSELGEILVLADYGPKELGSNHWDKMYRAIFVFNFERGEVEVIPQKWFNDGEYDFGYQWVTRVQRNPDTGRIVGEGIRLGNFELDDSSTQIKEWLEQDVFYHPEQV